MSISMAELMNLPNAQRVAGNIIVGRLADRVVLATNVDGVFGLTDAGRKYLAKLNGEAEAEDEAEVTTDIAPRATRGRKKKVEQPQVLDEPQETVVQDTTSAE